MKEVESNSDPESDGGGRVCQKVTKRDRGGWVGFSSKHEVITFIDRS